MNTAQATAFNWKDVEAFSRYFDALNSDTSHFQSSNDICTPMGCVREMADTVPDELWRRRGLKRLVQKFAEGFRR